MVTLISISIVSHGQGNLIVKLLTDLAAISGSQKFEVILTANIPEQLPFSFGDYPFPLRVVENSAPKGFGANHNAAFLHAGGDYFCVLNPDIRLPENPFPVLCEEISRRRAALAAPVVISPTGIVEDNIRYFPTLSSLLEKVLSGRTGKYAFALGDEAFATEWAAGMFMLFRASDFAAVAGFDEKYFMYYEDVDICARLWVAGLPIRACPQAHAVHDARRSSRKDVRYFTWHAASMIRYFWKHWGRLPKV